VKWISVAQYWDKWWALVNKVLNLQIVLNAGNFLTGWGTVRFWRRILLQGLSLVRSESFGSLCVSHTVIPHVHMCFGVRCVHFITCECYMWTDSQKSRHKESVRFWRIVVPSFSWIATPWRSNHQLLQNIRNYLPNNSVTSQNTCIFGKPTVKVSDLAV